VPALSRAARYDRIAGFFSSYALAVAAQGVARLVAKGGRMRLLVGAQLSPQDVEAVLQGISLQNRLSQQFLDLLQEPEALADALVRRRLEVLAWLVAHDQLEVRVVVEADPYTRHPVPSGDYFHAKGGIIRDDGGDGVAFSGSINETATAWRYNYETFHVFCSWREQEHFRHEEETFERLWENAEAGWATVALPDAVHQELVKLAPTEPPTEEHALQPAAVEDARDRWVAQFLRDAPFLVHNGWHVGVETALVEPFPHQRAVAYDVLDRFPCRRLLADEVGLGKTIEAGLILRSLLLSGWVKRCLILVPRSLAKQWQEELRDRFLVDAPFYDGARFVWFEHPENRYIGIPEGTSPWEVQPVVIASAQMVKRQERATGLLEASQWDLVIVDEAHHARRRDFLDLRRHRPNRLLGLLEQLRERTRGLLFLTATPMQVHPVEVWDLLRLLGLPGQWQEDQDSFLDYFKQMRQPYDEMDWETVLPLVQQAVAAQGWDSGWERAVRLELGIVDLQRIKGVLQRGHPRDALSLKGEQRRWLLEAVRRHNPVPGLMYRHTRRLLKEYHQRGLMKEHVPERRPEAVWLEMSPEEHRLYRDVERYISTYYKWYEEVRRGLGFIMTVYRRRLTSSLFALRRSLERHRLFLLGQWEDKERLAGLEDEDTEEADLERDVLEEMGDRPTFWDQEVREVDRLLEELGKLPTEQKFVALRDRLREALYRWDQVLVFTQYTDTLDFLRQELLPAFGSRLGCYSGRGGEVWDSSQQRWAGTSKERIQQHFAEGQLKVLLCTEAAGEGLNLQNCGVVINYDMPWNPMKVEQRIGRVDRIGQRRREVSVQHFFYERTVEAQVYRVLGDRIGWFETVVGELQPILQRAHTAIQRIAMVSPDEREPVAEEELAALADEYEARQVESSPTGEWKPFAEPVEANAPVTLHDLGRFLSDLPEASADSPSETANLTYGSAALDRFVRLPPPAARPDIVRLEDVRQARQVGYYRFEKGRWAPVRNVTELIQATATAPADRPDSTSDIQGLFEAECRRVRKA
jgi:SNF2 family DNA or RNA helicase